MNQQGHDENELERVKQERDLYLELLRLGSVKDIDTFLDNALEVLVSATGAQQGYIEFSDTTTDSTVSPWSTAYSCSPDDVENFRVNLSRGIIAEALAKGRIVSTDSALLDPRFDKRKSVQAGRIDAVLCAPIYCEHAIGVVYLCGRHKPGLFNANDKLRVEVLATHVGSFAERLLHREGQVSDADPTLAARSRIRVDDIVGRSRALATMLNQVALIAPLDVDILLTGEAGTGKKQLARIIHENSSRSRSPFVEVNCSGFDEARFDLELFGGDPATSTGAFAGHVAAAENGTLLLDEVSDIPLGSQAKLLELLRSRSYLRGHGSERVKANIRVIAATSVDLVVAVERKKFRQDLYYRLDVLPVRIPSLAARRSDINLLAERFCERSCERHAFEHLRLSPDALSALNASEWPGNIAQLAFAIERAVVRAASLHADEVRQSHIFPDERAEGRVDLGYQEATRKFQAELLLRTLQECDWNVMEASRRLDIARSHVYNLIRAFGLARSPGD